MARRAGDPWEYQTDLGILTFSPVEELFEPIFGLLRSGARPAWELEHDLGLKFELTSRERKAMLANGHRAWENHVAWALSRLRRRKSVTKIAIKPAPGRGRLGI